MWGVFILIASFMFFSNGELRQYQKEGKLDIYCPQPNMATEVEALSITLKQGDILQNVPHSYSFPSVGPHQGQTISHIDTWVWHNPDEETIRTYELEGWEDLK